MNFRIFEEFERLGVAFAFPSRTVYLAGDGLRQIASRLKSSDAA